MKIEKLTENKIRVIVKNSDFKTKCNDNSHIFNNILEILENANKQVGFNTDGCKLLIETISALDDNLVFTITKYNSQTAIVKKLRNIKPPKPISSLHSRNGNFIYKFENFDTFCNFCDHIYRIPDFNIEEFSKSMFLYLYKNTYYLVSKKANCSYEFLKNFDNIASEFATATNYSASLVSKLSEYGKLIWA